MVKNNLKVYFQKLKRDLKNNKGFLKDPRFYLGGFSVILFIFLSFGAGLIFKPVFPEGNFYFMSNVSEVFNFSSEQTLFLEQKGEVETIDLNLIQEDSLVGVSTPATFSSQVLGALVAGYEPEDTKMVITEYVAEEGDSLWSLADKFNISLNTILWANDLTEKSIIKPGDKLIILPVSGTIHHVKDGDTISGIAQTYKGKIDEMVALNQLANENGIYIGDIIIVPNGVMPTRSAQPKTLAQVPLASSYFIAPVPSPYRITQGLHWYNAIDFGGKCGDPIFAAASGKILKSILTSSTSRNAFGGAGNHLTILHPNGVTTMYAHLLTSFVNPGNEVSQGQIIALMGGRPGTPGAGFSTGCHVHFSVSGTRNPFAR